MEEKRNLRPLWITLAVVLGLLVSCSIGAVGGGLVGYWAGARTWRSARRPVPARPVVPLPEQPVPRLPVQPPDIEIPPLRGGVLVLEVVAGGPAARAGLRVDDIIISLDGKPVPGEADLRQLLTRYDPGDRVELQVMRQGRQRVVVVELGRNPRGGDTPWLGITIRTVPGLPSGRERGD